MSKYEEIKSILRDHAKEKTNLSSETARKLIAVEILEAIKDERANSD